MDDVWEDDELDVVSVDDVAVVRVVVDDWVVVVVGVVLVAVTVVTVV